MLDALSWWDCWSKRTAHGITASEGYGEGELWTAAAAAENGISGDERPTHFGKHDAWWEIIVEHDYYQRPQ